MARLARIVVPETRHHVTPRGNRREPIFFEDGDQEVYLDLLCEQLTKARVELWANCLMPNHVRLILCPATARGLAPALGAAHRRWANFVNARGRWRGRLFDGRFASVAMEEDHLIAAVRYIALNPVRARLVATAVVERGGLTWRLSLGRIVRERESCFWRRDAVGALATKP